MSSSSDVELISLSELIAKIKSDLLTPVDPADERFPMLFVDGIEITAQVVAKRERGESGKAGIGLKVLGFGADAGVDTKTTISSQLTQSVTVKLSPLLDRSEYLATLDADDKAKIARAVEKGVVRGSDEDAGPIA